MHAVARDGYEVRIVVVQVGGRVGVEGREKGRARLSNATSIN